MAQPFNSQLVFSEHISDATLRAYHVGFEQNKFRLVPLVNVIAEAIPEYALGSPANSTVPMTQIRSRLREAALRIYSTEDYETRGEFGEVILHLLLRDYCNTIPLISKIKFKDSINHTVHGFDAVHLVDTGSEKQLWLGESKLYLDGRAGVRDLASDIKKHLERDYLRSEFMLIKSKLPEGWPEVEYWRKQFDENSNLDDILDRVCIPAICTYNSQLFGDYNANTEAYFEALETECFELQQHFTERVTTTDVDVILMLLPIPSKAELVAALHERLKHMQKV